MAYCVHCGVKLGEAEPKCPLCGTEVHDPAQPFNENAPKAFPARTPEQRLRINRRYAVSLLSLLLLVPAGICLLIDIISDGISWSIYPAGVLVLIWIAVVIPLFIPRHRLYSSILINGATLALYLYMVELLSTHQGWFLPIVLPSLALAVAMTCLTVWLIRSKHMRILRFAAVICVEIGVLCLAIELLCVRSVAGLTVSWSPFVIMPCLFIALLLYVISRNGPISSELKRRFHF